MTSSKLWKYLLDINTNKNEQSNIYLVKNILQEMSQEQKLQQERLFKCHEEAITSIINSNTTTTKQRLDLLNKKINKKKQG